MDKINFLHEWVQKNLGNCSAQVERVEVSIYDEGESRKFPSSIWRQLTIAGVDNRLIRAASGERLCANVRADGNAVLQHGIAVLTSGSVSSAESLWDFIEACAARNGIDLSGEELCVLFSVFLKGGERRGWARVGRLAYLRTE